jgi:hypothetical protein
LAWLIPEPRKFDKVIIVVQVYTYGQYNS